MLLVYKRLEDQGRCLSSDWSSKDVFQNRRRLDSTLDTLDCNEIAGLTIGRHSNNGKYYVKKDDSIVFETDDANEALQWVVDHMPLVGL